MPHYIARSDAAGLLAPGEDIGEGHVFQGDIFHSVQMFTPRPGGAADWPLSVAVVVSHHCEWTKAANRPDYPITWAPAHELSAFDESQQNQIRIGRFRNFLYLPAEAPIDRELAVDLRLIQPVSARDVSEAMYCATCGPELMLALQGKVVEFFTRRLLDP